MQKPRVLALVGMAGSGKTLAAKHLEDKGFYQFRFGGIVTGEVERRGWAINPENERIVREEFRANEGMDVMAKRALPLLHHELASRETIVIDGLYSFSEYKTLRQEFGDGLLLIAIIAPRPLRYARLNQRPERPLTPAEAEKRDWQEIEALEKGGPIAIADYSLANDTSPEALLAALDALLLKLGVEA